ncbi:MAG TPA: immunoglobulin domain-containing protein [Candidatus Limnocylindria bacterium]|nr:immunoglobulin domain-containing protein [Candidatus Limnocylindria bacterium]
MSFPRWSLKASALALWLTVADGGRAQSTFTSVDIGSKSPAGITTAVDGGYDVGSSTGDIWDIADDCRFVYQAVPGDFDFQARVQALTGTAYWAKAGIMLRHSVADTSGEFSMLATRSSGVGYYASMTRYLTGYYTESHFTSAPNTGKVTYPNSWVRMVRVGDQAVALHSTNGVDWAQIGVEQLYETEGAAVVGLAVSTHTDAIGSRTTAQFRDVKLLRGDAGAPAVINQPLSGIVNPGDSLELSVTAVGQEPLTYQWFRNGEAIAGAQASSLVLTNLTATTHGKYACFITNSAGTLWSWPAAVEVTPAHEPFDGIYYERFGTAFSVQFDYIVNLPSYPDSPRAMGFRPLTELPSNLDDSSGSRLRGYLLAPQTGFYTFWIAADDNGTLFLSQDENPAGAEYIAECPYYVASRQWDYFDTQQSEPIYLLAGQRYYLEAHFKEADGPDHGAIGWQLPSGTLERPIPTARFRGNPAVLTPDHSAAGRFSLNGTTNSPYVLQQSSNLVDWATVLTNRAPFRFDAPADPSAAAQYFRATTVR